MDSDPPPTRERARVGDGMLDSELLVLVGIAGTAVAG
jgi:hypothetical protein